jgi:transposase
MLSAKARRAVSTARSTAPGSIIAGGRSASAASSARRNGSRSNALKGGLNSKLHAVCDGAGRPLVMLLSEGQMSDFKGAALVLSALPKAKELLADNGYDADWFRETLVQRKIAPCIPSKSNRKVPIPHDAVLYRQRHKIEIMFGRIKDWRRVHTRYDRCAHTYFSAICIAATVIFWL